ncbi:g4484 [Coccomyxa elongata]
MSQDSGQDSRTSKDSEEAPEHEATETRQEPSPEEEKYAAEFQRVAGLNKLEKGELTDPVSPFSFLIDGLRQLQGRLAQGAMLFQDKDFDEAEFLEGAKDAFYIVMTLWNEHDFTTLRTMTSGKLLSALRKGVEDYTNKNMSVRTSLTGDIHASFASYNFITEAELSEYDFPADSGLAKGSGRSTSATAFDDMEGTRAETIADTAENDFSMYSVVTVRFQCDQQITVANAGGQVVQEVTDKRHQLWRFVRGPLVGFPILHFPRDRPAPNWWLLDFV